MQGLQQQRVRNLPRHRVPHNTRHSIVSDLHPRLATLVIPLLQHQRAGSEVLQMMSKWKAAAGTLPGERRPLLRERSAIDAAQTQRGHKRINGNVVAKHDMEQRSSAVRVLWQQYVFNVSHERARGQQS